MIYEEKFLRNGLGKKQALIRKTTFAIVGLGGTGGFIFECLVRLGAENFIIFEADNVEISNFNRQILATTSSIDQPKNKLAIARAKSINQEVKIRAHGFFDSSKKSLSKLKGAKIVIDASDNVSTKVTLAKTARALKVPYVFCSANDSRGIVSVFLNYKFEKAFQIPKDPQKLGSYKTCSTIIAPVAGIAGSIAACEALNFIIGNPYPKAPNAIFFDMAKKEKFWRGKLG